jgi:hypothetical protein
MFALFGEVTGVSNCPVSSQAASFENHHFIAY